MSVSLCREDGMYEGGRELQATWRVSRVTLDSLVAIEISVLWSTEGKGDTDLHVHHFERLDEAQIRRQGLADSQLLRCELPATPLSYHGRLIRLRWCVRMRLFLSDGREIVTDQPFYLVAPRTNENRPSSIVGDEPRRASSRGPSQS
ncbi:hypothetical protein FYK55_12560 [Roseiconus nitratireducens]|uniref:Uncharacterized protein n=1 Tax=Roseiconus nitratireducens TaxID=2605748 RepID=A0A5M6DA00_9BACT|nr:hypothetical protein [Roseiconus nitratireducens]KAA5543112.1 hypothetical protein FYK55_12560 [Roseiconus nitratireducens]